MSEPQRQIVMVRVEVLKQAAEKLRELERQKRERQARHERVIEALFNGEDASGI